ncbi:ATP-binding protein [Candidatus Margulisiibacteriota bacterium]
MPNVFSLSSLLGCFASIALGAWIYSANHYNLANRIFIWLCAALAYNSFIEFMLRHTITIEEAALWLKAGSFWPFVLSLFLHFILEFTENSHLKKHNKLNLFLIYAPAFFFSFIDYFTSKISGLPVEKFWGFSNAPEPNATLIFALIWIIMIIVSSFMLILFYYLSNVAKVKKQQSKYLLIGMSFPITAFFITETYAPWAGLNVPELTNSLLAVMIGFISIGIWKHDLFYISTATTAENIINTMPDSLILFDPNLNIVDTNNAILELLNIERKDIIGRSISYFIDDSDMVVKKDAIPKLIESGMLSSFSTYIKKRGGRKLPIRVSCSAVKTTSNKTTSIIFIIHDMSDIWKLMEETKVLQQELIEADKLAALGKMAAGIAHEINNPLFVISGEAEMLAKDAPNAEVKESVKTILAQANRIKEITKNLLNFVNKKIQQELVEVNEIINKTLNLISYQTKMESVNIKMNLQEKLPHILGSGVQLEEVYLNIVQNAFDAMSGKGDLYIETRTCQKEDKEFIITTIKDTGPGIDQDIIHRIFDPLFSTKNNGVGLGLAICSKIIQNHNGRIEVDSEIGAGTTFTITLPIYKTLNQQEEAK